LVEEILIEEENLQEALDSIRRLLTDSELRRFMGRRNFEIVKTAYSESNAMELFKILTGN
jgi:hypothetical protein